MLLRTGGNKKKKKQNFKVIYLYMLELGIPVSHDMQGVWVRSVNKIQLLVKVLKECVSMAVYTSLIYWPTSWALYLK